MLDIYQIQRVYMYNATFLDKQIYLISYDNPDIILLPHN